MPRALVAAGRIDRVVVYSADVLTAEEAFAGVCASTLFGPFSEEAVAKLVERLELVSTGLIFAGPPDARL